MSAVPVNFDLRPNEVADEPSMLTRPDGFITNVRRPTLTFWPPPANIATGTGVIICPGGGYESLAVDHEGVALARWLNTLGVAAFVLHYRVPHPGHPGPLEDAQRALQLVLSRATEFGLAPNRIGMLGSSAGGHLAACAGTLALDAGDRPDFLVLLYPVITMREACAHVGSRRALLGPSPSTELTERLSVERQVTAETPPTFLVHAADDTPVPPENSLLFFAALQRAGVPAELHIYERGFHGFGLGAENEWVRDWPDRCARWMRAHGWLPGAG